MGRKSMMSPHYGFVHDELEFPSDSSTQVKLKNINGTFVVVLPDGSTKTLSNGITEQDAINKYNDTTAAYYKDFKTFTERFTAETRIDTTASLEENYDATNDYYQARPYEIDYMDADRSGAYTAGETYAGGGAYTLSDDTVNAKYHAHSVKIAFAHTGVSDADADWTIAPVKGANLDLSGVDTVYFWARCSEVQTTSKFLTVSITDGTGGEIESDLCEFAVADTWYRFSIDLSGVADANKSDIDTVSLKVATGMTNGEHYIVDYITCDKGTEFYLESDETESTIIGQLNNIGNALSVYAFVSEDTTNAPNVNFDSEMKMMVSRDARTTETEITIGDWEYCGVYASGKRLYRADVDISAQPEDGDLAFTFEGRGHDFGDYINIEGLVFTW